MDKPAKIHPKSDAFQNPTHLLRRCVSPLKCSKYRAIVYIYTDKITKESIISRVYIITIMVEAWLKGKGKRRFSKHSVTTKAGPFVENLLADKGQFVRARSTKGLETSTHDQLSR